MVFDNFMGGSIGQEIIKISHRIRAGDDADNFLSFFNCRINMELEYSSVAAITLARASKSVFLWVVTMRIREKLYMTAEKKKSKRNGTAYSGCQKNVPPFQRFFSTTTYTAIP